LAPGLDGVIDHPVEHSDAADASVVSDADAAVFVERDGRHLAGATGPVLVVAVVLRHRVVVVVVDVCRRLLASAL